MWLWLLVVVVGRHVPVTGTMILLSLRTPMMIRITFLFFNCFTFFFFFFFVSIFFFLLLFVLMIVMMIMMMQRRLLPPLQ